MGLLDALKKLTKPYSDDDYLDEDLEEQPARASLFPRRDTRSYTDYAAAPAPAEQPSARRSLISAVRQVENNVAGNGGAANGSGSSAQPLKLLVMKPERFEDAADIADHMRQRHSIVLNLEATPKEITRRLVDFLSGVAYALDGRIKRIANGTYIITPANVDLMGDELSSFETKEIYF